ncbi:sigma-70 family RNA polymerase sigma factor [Flagellimonas olearia]|uniref:Sigma-70 family RNA polymerase sigma factor n=1 Tax=Flagellimonas olearia TaxID=552546 RepID=A0A6I1DZI7_9FLAO|nr:sigma-70 family RNA polymerase sigma factor [Allomuricauda olearia]KAB7530257.1 sigma-70 family RNA polymerase sigma factor [Allomuricauda olearia]
MKSFNESDELLVSQIKQGNKKAYNFAVQKYHDRIFSYVFSLTNDYEQAQDIIQNTFLKTWEFRDKLDPVYPIKSFLFRTAYNEFITLYHKNRAISNLEKKFVEMLDQMNSEENDDMVMKKINIIRVEIEKLPVKCKEVFLLSKKEGLTNTEIASHLSISIKAVEGQITKAYSILRKSCLEKVKNFLFLLFGPKLRPL